MAYTGLFLRDQLGQTPTSSAQSWTSSPDIILYGQNPATDLSIFTTPEGYANPFDSTVYLGQQNWVYVRALNATAGATTGRFWLYYTPSNVVLWPQQWQYGSISVRGVGQNHVDVAATTPNQIVVGSPGFLWTPPALGQGADHYCMIAFAENPPLSDPPTSPAPVGYMDTWDALANYVITHPNMAWRNTIDVSRDNPTWQQSVQVSGADAGGQFLCGIKMTDMPTDGFYSFSVLGPDNKTTSPNQDSIVIPKVQINDPNQNFTIPITWPKGYVTSMQISYWQGATKPPLGAAIEPNIIVPVSVTMAQNRALADAMERCYSRATDRIRPEEWPADLRMPRPVLVYDSPAMANATKTYAHVIGSAPLRFK